MFEITERELFGLNAGKTKLFVRRTNQYGDFTSLTLNEASELHTALGRFLLGRKK